MNNDDNHGRGRNLRERIVSLIRANDQASKKQITTEELRKLTTASSRLDQMLQAGADADRQDLTSAAARLDQLLADIRAGKDVAHKLMRRRNSQNRISPPFSE